MNAADKRYCKQCGAVVPEDGKFCESCGAPIGAADSPQPERTVAPTVEPVPGSPKEKVEDFWGEDLPDPKMQPRLGRALSVGWDLLSLDVGGAFLTGFLFIVVMAVLCTFLSILSPFIAVALAVGLLAWAEERRRGLESNVGTIFRLGANRFLDALILGLVFMLIIFIGILPLIITFFSFFVWLFAAVLSGVSSTDDFPFMQLFMGPPLIFGGVLLWILVYGLIISPVLQSLVNLTAWAIAMGKPFSEAFMWAWERIKARFVDWWLAGLVISFVVGLGFLLCYVGILFSLPWGYLAWAEICGDHGVAGKRAAETEASAG